MLRRNCIRLQHQRPPAQQQQHQHSAARFGDLLRNNNNNNQQQQNQTPQKSSTTTTTASRPFVRDIRSLRNRVKLDDFIDKRNGIIKSVIREQQQQPQSSSSLLPSLTPPFSQQNQEIASKVNEALNTLTDRNGHIPPDEILYQSLKVNAESGDIVTSAELLRRILSERRTDSLCIIASSGASSSTTSSLLPTSFGQALFAVDLLLQSALNELSVTTRPMHVELMKYAVWNKKNNNTDTSPIFENICSNNNNNNNPFFNLRSATLNMIPIDSTSAVASDFFTSSFNASTASMSQQQGDQRKQSSILPTSSSNSFSSTPEAIAAGTHSSADLSSLLLADDASTALSSVALKQPSNIGGPHYTALRPYLESIVSNLFQYFRNEIGNNNNNNTNTIIIASNPIFVSLFCTCVRAGDAVDLFSFSAGGSSSLALVNVFAIAEKILSSSSTSSFSEQLSGQLDEALFLAYRQIFVKDNIMLRMMNNEGEKEKQRKEEKEQENSINKAINEIMERIFDDADAVWRKTNYCSMEMTLALWNDQQKCSDDNESSKASTTITSSTIVRAINAEKQLLNKLNHNSNNEESYNRNRETLETALNEVLSSFADDNKLAAAAEQYLTVPLLLSTIHLSNEDCFSLLASTLNKILAKNNEPSSSIVNNNESLIRVFNFCCEALSEIFTKMKEKLSGRVNATQLEDVNATIVNEEKILSKLMISRLALRFWNDAGVSLVYENIYCSSNLLHEEGKTTTKEHSSSSLLLAVDSFSGICRLMALLGPELTIINNNEDNHTQQQLDEEIRVLEERKKQRRIEIFGNEDEGINNDDGDQEGSKNNNSDMENNNNNISSNDSSLNNDEDDLFGSSGLPTSNKKSSSPQKKVDEMDDEFDQILASGNKDNSSNNTSSSQQNDDSSATNNIMDDDTDTLSVNDYKTSAEETAAVAHSSLCLLKELRRGRRRRRNISLTGESSSSSIVVVDQSLIPSTVVRSMDSTVFNHVFYSAREIGDEKTVERMSKEREYLYDPVKLM